MLMAVCVALGGAMLGFHGVNFEKHSSTLLNSSVSKNVVALNQEFTTNPYVFINGEIYSYQQLQKINSAVSSANTFSSVNDLQFDENNKLELVFYKEYATVSASGLSGLSNADIASQLQAIKNADGSVNIKIIDPTDVVSVFASADANGSLYSLMFSANATLNLNNGSFSLGEKRGSTSFTSTTVPDALLFKIASGSVSFSGSKIYSPRSTTVQGDGGITTTVKQEGRAFYQTGGTLTLDGITLDGFYVSAGNGGAVSSANGTLNLTTCTIKNSSAGNGGAVYATNTAVNVVGATLEANSATANGGAIYADETSTLKIDKDVDTSLIGTWVFSSSECPAGLGMFHFSGTIDGKQSSGVLQIGYDPETFSEKDSVGSWCDDGGYAFVTKDTVLVIESVEDNTNEVIDWLKTHATKQTTPIATTFIDNTADYGGAMYITDSVDAVVNKVVFDGNSASTYGGAIHSTTSNDLILESSTFTGNSAVGYAAIYSTEDVGIMGGTFDDNFADGGNGGVVSSNGDITVLNVTFTNNKLGDEGSNSNGLIFANNVTIVGGTFSGNQVYGNGGVVVSAAEGGNIIISGGTFENNSATGNGGVVYANSNQSVDIYEESAIGTWVLNDTVEYIGMATFDIQGLAFFENQEYNTPFSAMIFHGYLDVTGDNEGKNEYTLELEVENGTEFFCGVIVPGGSYGRIVYSGFKTFTMSKNSNTAPTYINQITITGGDDIANTQLLTWLKANATRQTQITTTAQTFSGNSAANGGVIYMGGDSANLNIYGGTFTGNSATTSGGVIWAGEGTAVNISPSALVSDAESAIGTWVLNDVIKSSSCKMAFSYNIDYTCHYEGTDGTSQSSELSLETIDVGSMYGNDPYYIWYLFKADYCYDSVSGCMYSGSASSTVQTRPTSNLTKCTTAFTIKSITITGGDDVANADLIAFLRANATKVVPTFTSNTAESNGGVIWAGGTVNILEGVFTGNSATSGGVAHVEGGTANISSGTFTENTASNGGVLCFNQGNLTISGGTFTGNIATNEGGVVSVVENNTVSVGITGGTFTENTASNGGVVATNLNSKNVSLSITEGDYYSNEAVASGGVVYIGGNTSSASISGVKFTNNTAGYGGGAVAALGAVNITYCAFLYNTAENIGGAVYSAGTLNVENCRFDGNQSTGNGGAIGKVMQSANLLNNIFNGNNATNGGGVYASAGTVTMYASSACFVDRGR